MCCLGHILDHTGDFQILPPIGIDHFANGIFSPEIAVCSRFGQNKLIGSIESCLLITQDEAKIMEQITSADDINKKVRDNVEREKARRAADIANDNWQQTDVELKDATANREKARLAARENLPIPNLDISESAVLYKGKPLSQAGKSAELRVSVAVAIALNKDKRVKLLLIDDAEKLDADNVKVVMEMAHEAGFQVIMARVGDGKTASVVIEDGEIKG